MVQKRGLPRQVLFQNGLAGLGVGGTVNKGLN
jgi:hypothetical protein